MPNSIQEVVRQVSFRYTAPPMTGVRLSELCPLTGKATQVTMHWPDGCNALVGMALHYDGEQICPIRGYHWLNDATPTWTMSIDVRKNAVFWLDILNQDMVESHTVSAIVTMIGVEE